MKYFDLLLYKKHLRFYNIEIAVDQKEMYEWKYRQNNKVTCN